MQVEQASAIKQCITRARMKFTEGIHLLEERPDVQMANGQIYTLHAYIDINKKA